MLRLKYIKYPVPYETPDGDCYSVEVETFGRHHAMGIAWDEHKWPPRLMSATPIDGEAA